MMKLQTLAAMAAGIALTGVAFVLATCAFDTNHAAARAADVDAELLNNARSNFQPLPKDMSTPEFPITPSRVELGWKLFFDPRISVDGTVSCARCHQPALYGTDGLPKARGAHDTLNPRNVPTILNAALQFKARIGGAIARMSRTRRSRC
jgi:cytochrome c peroxidase